MCFKNIAFTLFIIHALSVNLGEKKLHDEMVLICCETIEAFLDASPMSSHSLGDPSYMTEDTVSAMTSDPYQPLNKEGVLFTLLRHYVLPVPSLLHIVMYFRELNNAIMITGYKKSVNRSPTHHNTT